MFKLVLSVNEKLLPVLHTSLNRETWELIIADEQSFADLSMKNNTDFLLLQAQAAPAFYRRELMRMFRAGCAPHVILFSLDGEYQLASSSAVEKPSDRYREALNQLYKGLYMAIIQRSDSMSGSFQFVECADISRRAARFAYEENLREIISGVTREQYRTIVKTQKLNLAPQGHLMLITKAMPYDYFNDYTHNRRVYYMLDELQREAVYRILDEYSGGEMFEASKNSKCIIINDFHRSSQRKYRADLDDLLAKIRLHTDDGMTALFMGSRVDEPEEFNNVYRECINAKRMRLFYGEEKILPVSVLKQKRELPDMEALNACLEAVRGFSIAADDEEFSAQIKRLFLDILKNGANINMYYYSCSALNVIYDAFCSQYDIDPERRAMSRCFDKYVTVEEMAAHYISIFLNAKERVRACYSNDSFLAFRMTGFIQNNYSRDLSLEDLANYVGLSRNYTSTCFRTHLGVTFSDYLTNYRIERAKELLAAPGRPKIIEVAAAVGYQNAQFFSRVFKARVGVSPREYAAQEH